MLVKEKFCRKLLNKKIKITLTILFFYFFCTNLSRANFQENLINKYNQVNTLHFNFTQTIGNKVENGNCFIKYPLHMKCEYPKKKKIIITNGKKFVIIKKRYKKIYIYPLKKTPLFFLLDKKNVLNIIKNFEPSLINSNIIEYELSDSKANKLNILFNKNSLDLAGWKTTDAYSNEVNFLIKNLKTNILVKDEIFKIPREEDL